MTGAWRKARRSQGNGGACVEARQFKRDNQLRDSKLAETSPIITVCRDDFTALLKQVK